MKFTSYVFAVIWKTSPSVRFPNNSGRDQLSQVGSQINIITSKHTLLYKYLWKIDMSQIELFD